MLGRKLARWAKDNFKAIAACDPVMPPAAYNRLGDNWRPLFAIAQTIGGHWPERLAEAFNQINAKPQQAPDVGLVLLADIRDIFAKSGAERMFSATVAGALRLLAERPWSGAANRNGLSIDEAWLGRQLRRFGVRSKTLRIGEERAKGYELRDFADAFNGLRGPGLIEANGKLANGGLAK
jgi:hypothetical protein